MTIGTPAHTSQLEPASAPAGDQQQGSDNRQRDRGPLPEQPPADADDGVWIVLNSLWL